MNIFNQNHTIYVAGSEGMVGSSICRLLKKKGYKDKGKKLVTISRRELDLRDEKKLEDWFDSKRPDIVIIAAAKVGGILANKQKPVDFLLDNLKIQNNLIEKSYKFGVKRLLFLGSSCIYPKFATQPLIEDALLQGYLEETNESYAIAKIAGIKLCQALRKQYGFDAISLMPTNLYGPKDNYDPDNSHVMASLIRKFCTAKEFNEKKVICWGTGAPFREFLHVNDLGEAATFALENWNPNATNAPKDKFGKPLQLLNVGTGQDISIKELTKKIALMCKYEGEIIWDKDKPDGTPRKLLDISNLKSIGWQSKITLEDGIKLTIKEFREMNKFKKF